MQRHHLIISGVGRSGTTLLVKLFTHLGFDTGFARDNLPTFDNCHAGLEIDIRSASAPYVIKDPWLCDYIEEVIADSEIVIDHVIIPIRDLEAAAESRRYVHRITDRTKYPKSIPGGLWHTNDPGQQEEILAKQLYKLLVALSKIEIRISFIHYPKLTIDARYLFDMLKPTLGNIKWEFFKQVFDDVVDGSIVHKFTERDC